MRTAYSYIRMSTEKQLNGDSLRRQLLASATYAKNNDLNIDNTPLTDIGSGFRGENSRTGTLSRFLYDLEAGKIKPNSVLLIESLDRLSRDRLSSALTQFMRILELGIEIITLSDNQKYTKAIIDQNPGALFISLGIMFRANEESEIKSKRLTAAWVNKRAKSSSKVLTKLCPAWMRYNEETQKFELIEERVKVVKSIFNMCINTFGIYRIARNLNENKVPIFGRGKFWHKSYITKILKNRSVIGEFQPRVLVEGKRVKTDNPIANYFPAILDEKTFMLAQVAVARRTLNGAGCKGTNFTNLFAGLSYCNSCGSKMLLRNRGGTDRSSKKLLCSNQIVHAGCQMSEWTLADLEEIIFRHLKEVNFTDLLDVKNDDKTMSLEDEKLALIEKLRGKEQDIERGIDSLVDSDLLPDVKQRLQTKINNLSSEIKNIEKEIDDISKQIMDKVENETVFSTMALKEMIEELKTRQDDYEFRSSVNNFLSRAINRFEMIDANEPFMPWDLDEDSPIVKSYRLTYPIRATRSLDELVSTEDFKQFYRRYNREIRIHYQTGAVRNILFGANISFGNANMQEIYSKAIAKVKPVTDTVVTDATDTVISVIDKPIQ
ncbi:MAG: recombinase family protein [Methylotenera sp.]